MDVEFVTVTVWRTRYRDATSLELIEAEPPMMSDPGVNVIVGATVSYVNVPVLAALRFPYESTA
ncbi:MAG: hypothetical protein EBX99_09175 [Acidimicrobiia bacterium]|nr:hypothetical protein [Acidimicrobiia bacterium]